LKICKGLYTNRRGAKDPNEAFQLGWHLFPWPSKATHQNKIVLRITM